MTGENADAGGGFPASAETRPARVFVALKIAPEIALALAAFGRGLEKFSVRAVAVPDIHLTLVPPWAEMSMPEAVEKLRSVADKHMPFELAIRHVGYGPEPRRPRFLWADCVASEPLASLRASLLQVYGQTDERPFRPHVTLARLHDKGRKIARALPVDEDLDLVQYIETVELMQSPRPGERGYKVVASLPLRGKPEFVEAT